MNVYDMFLSFFTYGFLGWCTEVAFAAVKQRQFVNRGFLNGPICPIYGVGVTVVIAVLAQFTDHIVFLYLASTLLVTVLEGITGYLLEKLFHHRWWDYSKMPLNIGGYVCVLFSFIWGIVCVLIVEFIHPLLYSLLLLIPKWLGITLLIGLCCALFTDIYVTAAGILKWNRRLDRLDEIAGELHRISDQIGENIYENMMTGIERQEKTREKAEALTEEVKLRREDMKVTAEELKRKAAERRQRAEELRAKYEEMLTVPHKTGKRLLKAFPQLKSKEHDVLVSDLRNRLKKIKK
ncbi:MAG: hypothetical protein UC961_05920 [Emergencia sp.]|nr:hypothetical protein [Emergencia sp.]